jgi:ABC-2 type transport system permease protein
VTEATSPPGTGQLPGYRTLLAGQVSYQARLLLRTPRAIFAGILLPVLLLLVRQTNSHIPADAQVSLVAGLAVFGVVSTAFLTQASNLVAARESGVLRRWRASPLPRWCLFGGRIAATVVLADVSGLITVLVARLTGTAISAAAFGLVLIPISLGVLAWASIGTASTGLIPDTSSAYPLLAAAYLPVLFFSGGLGASAASNEPRWVATFMSYLPAQPVIDGASRALHSGSGAPFPLSGHDFLVLAAWTIAGLIASARLFSWSPRPARPRRAGRAAAGPEAIRR